MLPKAIESVVHQSFDDWELIVIDDGSTDGTKDIVEGYSDNRIVYLRNEKNIERSASRNRGIGAAKGQYICFLDSDDYYLENHLEGFYEVIQKQNVPKAVLYCNTYEEVNGQLNKITHDDIKTSNDAEHVLANYNGIPRACIHAEILQEFRFNVEYTVGEDLDLLFRIVQKYPLIGTAMYTTVYLTHEGRTVHINNQDTFITHIERIKKLLKLDGGALISKKIRNTVLSVAYFNLGRHHLFKNQNLKATYALLRSFLFMPKHRWKENLYLIIDSYSLTKWFLNIYSRRNRMKK